MPKINSVIEILNYSTSMDDVVKVGMNIAKSPTRMNTFIRMKNIC